MHVIGKLSKTVYIFPYAFVAGVEQMRTVFVDLGTGLFIEI